MTIQKLNFTRILFLVLVSASFFFACKTESKQKEAYETIVSSKKWAYDVAAIRATVDSLNITPDEMNRIGWTLTNLGGAVFHFREGGQFLLDLPDRTVEGKWFISDDAKSFNFGLNGSVLSTHPIKELNESVINLESGDNPGIFYPRIFKVAESVTEPEAEEEQ